MNRLKYLFLAFLFTLLSCSNEKPYLKIGLVADPQYADKAVWGSRHYRESLGKLKLAIDTFNNEQVDFVQNLGDIIDKDRKSYDAILPIYGNLNPGIENYHTLGNHEYSIDSADKDDLLEILSMPDYYYAYEKKGWRFIVLNSTDQAFFSRSAHGYNPEQVESYFKKIEGKSNQRYWNAGIGKEQQNWLRTQLDSSEMMDQRVIVFAHIPLKPLENAHNLWNNDEIINIIEDSPNVFAYINGHNHSGGYIYDNGIHYITIHGMVEKEESSFGILEIYKDSVVLKGYGYQPGILLSDK